MKVVCTQERCKSCEWHGIVSGTSVVCCDYILFEGHGSRLFKDGRKLHKEGYCTKYTKQTKKRHRRKDEVLHLGDSRPYAKQIEE